MDEQHNQLLKDWRDHLKPRKKVHIQSSLTTLSETLRIFFCIKNKNMCITAIQNTADLKTQANRGRPDSLCSLEFGVGLELRVGAEGNRRY